jgi:hypothetical protein
VFLGRCRPDGCRVTLGSRNGANAVVGSRKRMDLPPGGSAFVAELQHCGQQSWWAGSGAASDDGEFRIQRNPY